jgi:hypothetical protein
VQSSTSLRLDIEESYKTSGFLLLPTPPTIRGFTCLNGRVLVPFYPSNRLFHRPATVLPKTVPANVRAATRKLLTLTFLVCVFPAVVRAQPEQVAPAVYATGRYQLTHPRSWQLRKGAGGTEATFYPQSP